LRTTPWSYDSPARDGLQYPRARIGASPGLRGKYGGINFEYGMATAAPICAVML